MSDKIYNLKGGHILQEVIAKLIRLTLSFLSTCLRQAGRLKINWLWINCSG
jgi:hypothetical protein